MFGILRSALERDSQVIGPYDLQIAAQAMSRELPLVKNNMGEFSRIRGLKLENRASP